MGAEIERLKATISHLNTLNDKKSTEISRLKKAMENLETAKSPLTVSDPGSLSGTGDLQDLCNDESQRRSLNLGSADAAIVGERLARALEMLFEVGRE